MAIELTTVFKTRDFDVDEAARYAARLESALGDVLLEERMAGITAYFVAANGDSNSLRVGMRFEDMAEEHLESTASEMLDLAVAKAEADPVKHQLKKLSSQLVSA